jgi:hypothetical protein
MSGSDTKQVVKRLVEAYQNSEYAVATISKIKQITSNIVIYQFSSQLACGVHEPLCYGFRFENIVVL